MINVYEFIDRIKSLGLTDEEFIEKAREYYLGTNYSEVKNKVIEEYEDAKQIKNIINRWYGITHPSLDKKPRTKKVKVESNELADKLKKNLEVYNQVQPHIEAIKNMVDQLVFTSIELYEFIDENGNKLKTLAEYADGGKYYMMRKIRNGIINLGEYIDEKFKENKRIIEDEEKKITDMVAKLEALGYEIKKKEE